MARATNQDAGKYNQPAIIQKQANWADNGQGGNANANTWVTIRSPMIALNSGKAGRGASLSFRYGQMYPEATHYAECIYANDVAIVAGMRLLINNRPFRILGAEDEGLRHVNTVIALKEEQAKGSV